MRKPASIFGEDAVLIEFYYVSFIAIYFNISTLNKDLRNIHSVVIKLFEKNRRLFFKFIP